GFIMMGIGTFNENALSGSIYYLIHDMIIKTALFLLIGAICYIAGTSDLRKMNVLINHYPILGWLYFLSAIVLACITPFSGFIGNVFLFKGALANGEIAIVIIALLTSLLILYSILKIFIRGFWGEKQVQTQMEKKSTKGYIAPVVLLLTLSVLLGIGGEFFYISVVFISR